MKIGEDKINYFDYISSLKNEDCTAALLRIAPRINMDKINKMINEIDSISELQKKFYLIWREDSRFLSGR